MSDIRPEHIRLLCRAWQSQCKDVFSDQRSDVVISSITELSPIIFWLVTVSHTCTALTESQTEIGLAVFRPLRDYRVKATVEKRLFSRVDC